MFDGGSLQYAPDASGRETLLRALASFAGDDFSVRLPVTRGSLDAEVAAAFNAAAEASERRAEQGRRLAERMRQVEIENAAIARAHRDLAQRAEQLARRSRALPAHLVGVSTEQRSLLNSMLMLAKLLADDTGNHLSPTQIDYAQTIYSAGTQLLSLIEDIFELAQAEAETALFDGRPERFADIADYCRQTFRPLAASRNLDFAVELAPGLPDTIRSDGVRLRQILRSLLSHAFTFARRGGVRLCIAPVASGRDHAVGRVKFSVVQKRNGRQGDAAWAGEDAGGGPDLVVCRELAGLLGGEIVVAGWERGHGRSTLLLPLPHEPAVIDEARVLPATTVLRCDAVRSGRTPWPVRAAGSPAYRGPRSRYPDDGIVLIADDDPRIAAGMLDLARKSGYRGELAADLGRLRTLVREARPVAIILGMNFAGNDGWTVLDLLRRDPETGQLPVCMTYARGPVHECVQTGVFCRAADGAAAPAGDELPRRVLAGLGAVADREVRRILVVDTAGTRHADAVAAWRRAGLDVVAAASGTQGLAALRGGTWDAVVVGTGLPDMTATQLMKRMLAADLPGDLPIAVVGADDGGTVEIGILRRRRALDEVFAATTLFLRKALGEQPSAGRRMPASGRRSLLELAGRKALIVDDEILDIYAMTGVLEQQGMIVLHAESGAEGIEVLRANPDTDVVLVDTQVTAREGQELIGHIRAMAPFASLPIIAVTAGGGHGNRELCIAAGASDYIDKPVNGEQLLSLLRAWLIGLRCEPPCS